MTLLSRKGLQHLTQWLGCTQVMIIFFLLCSRDPSYLKTLLKPFNEITNEFLDELKSLADGETKVPMKTHLGEFSLDVISKVAILVQCANTFHIDLIMLFLLAMDLYIPYI